MKILNNAEISYVSGGWTCASTYREKPFRKAVWRAHANIDNRGMSVGVCHYGSDDDSESYFAPKNLTGIVQKPMNFWSFAGDMAGYSSYECLEKDASDCVFKEA